MRRFVVFVFRTLAVVVAAAFVCFADDGGERLGEARA